MVGNRYCISPMATIVSAMAEYMTGIKYFSLNLSAYYESTKELRA